MAILHLCLLLAVLRMTAGQSTTSESHCSYMLKLPAAECGRTPVDEQFMKSSMIALQTQMTQMNLVSKKQAEDIRKLTEENEKLRHKIASIEAERTRSTVNLKQCSMRNLNEYSKHGLLYSCEFVKKRNGTVLRVVWNGDLCLMSSALHTVSCRRWFFTINGKECSDPRTIDTQLYVNDDKGNWHRPAYVEGYCRGIAAGDVYVAWNVGDCESQKSYNIGNSYTGWVSSLRIIVEEVDVESAETVIV